MQAIQAGNDDAYEALLQLDVTASDVSGVVSVKNILEALLASEWRESDLFQVPLLLFTILQVDADRSWLGQLDEASASRVRRLIEVVLNARPRRRFGSTQSFSDYILFQCARAYAELQASSKVPSLAAEKSDKSESYSEQGIAGLPASAIPEGAANSLSLALARCVEVSQNELCRQLAFRTAGDYSNFDVVRLAYSLLTYLTSTSSLEGTAGLELLPGGGPSPGTQISAANPKLVTAALQAFFAEQLSNGLWDKGQPIYKSFRKQGRNVGNAFVFSLDTLGTMLELIPSEYFRPYLRQLESTLDWISTHQTVEVIADFCDPESGQCYGRPLRGWASPHLNPDTTPQAWCTAQALHCVSHLRRQLRVLMHQDVLEEFRGVLYSKAGRVRSYWDRLLDSDLGQMDGGKPRTLKEVLNDRVASPFADSVGTPSFGAAYSAILFGPPGK